MVLTLPLAKSYKKLTDHGTAFDLAGKGKANPDSFKEALFSTIKLFGAIRVFFID